MIGLLAAAALTATAAWPGDWRPSPAQGQRLAAGEVVVEMLPDPGRSSGVIHAAVDIAAPLPRVWAIVQDCAGAPRIVTFLESCRILAHGPPDTWDVREDMIATAFFLPRLRTYVRTDDTPLRQVRFRCLAGSELKSCDGGWSLETTPTGATRVIYASTVSSPYPLPDFLIRTVLGSGMNQSMTNLRRAAAGR
jgi:hypothetical protein